MWCWSEVVYLFMASQSNLNALEKLGIWSESKMKMDMGHEGRPVKIHAYTQVHCQHS